MRRIGWTVLGLVAGAASAGVFLLARRAHRAKATTRTVSRFEPAVAFADEALESGDPAVLRKLGAADGNLEDRFRRVVEARPHASESVAKGRQYTAAYVDFVNAVDRLRGEAERIH
jgi:hypothetical protein